MYAAMAAFLKEPRDRFAATFRKPAPLSFQPNSRQAPSVTQCDEKVPKLPVSNAHQSKAASKYKDRPEGYWEKESRKSSSWPLRKPSYQNRKDFRLDPKPPTKPKQDLVEHSRSLTSTSSISSTEPEETSSRTRSPTPTIQASQSQASLHAHPLEIDHSSHPAIQEEVRRRRIDRALWNQYCRKACGWKLSHGLPSEWWQRTRREESIFDSEETLEEMSRHHTSRFGCDVFD